MWHYPNTTRSVDLSKRNECDNLQTRPGVWNSPNVMSVVLFKHDKACGNLQTRSEVWHTLQTRYGVLHFPNITRCLAHSKHDSDNLNTPQGVWNSPNVMSVALFKHDNECGTLQTPQGVWNSPKVMSVALSKHHKECGSLQT